MSATTSPAPVEIALGALYLTQILVPYDEAVRTLRIRDSYDWHQRVWQAFAGRDGETRDFLIRIDRQDEAFRVLLLSRTPASRPAWCPTDCFGTKLIPDDYFAHRHFRFRLLANPTKKIRVDNSDGTRKRNGKRVPLTKREDLIDWLARKGVAGGFDIDAESVRVVPRGRSMFQKDGAQGHHSAVEFQGDLVVTNTALFRNAIATGIGSAKAFGFGMLVIAPIS